MKVGILACLIQTELPDRIMIWYTEVIITCPKTVQRCEQCRIAFGRNDVVMVKTVGNRERTDKNGKTVKYQGNVYLHYLTSCLREYDRNFSFKNVVVSARTLALLPDNSRQIFLDKGLKVE